MPIQIIPPDTPQYDQFGRRIQQPVPVMHPAPQQPIAPVANIPAPVTQEQQQPQIPAPDFSPVKIVPAAPTVSEAALAQERPLDPNAPEYQNSRLRTVLNAIAGGLAGAAGGPKVGFEVGENLRNLKYNEAVAAQNRRIALLGEQGKAEQAQFKRGESSVQEGVKRGVAESSDIFRAGNLAARNRDITNKEQETLIKQQRANAMQKYNEWKMKNPKLDDMQYILSLENPQDRANALDVMKEMRAAKEKSDEEIRRQAAARAEGTAQGQLTPAGREATAIRAAASPAAKTAEEMKQFDEGAYQSIKSLAANDPDTATATIKQYPQAVRAEITNRLAKEAADGTALPPKLPTREAEQLRSSNVTEQHVKNIMQTVNDPKIRPLLAPLAGRVKLIKNRVGVGEKEGDRDQLSLDTHGLTDEQDREFSSLVTQLNYLLLWEARAISGTRPAQGMIDMMKKASANPGQAESVFLGHLDGIMKTVNANRKGILHQSLSGQEHSTKSVNPPGGKPLTPEEERKKKFLDSFKVVPEVAPPGGKK